MKQALNKRYVLLIYAALALATFLTFHQVCFNDFVNYDDPRYVTENPHVIAGLTPESALWAFTTPHGDVSYWHPLTWLSHMFDCQLFGANPGAHHLTNLLLHIANTLLLFSLFRWMTGALWRSAFVAAVFAFHPLHVESIAWISERKDVLSTFFWLLTVIAYLRYVKRPRTSRYLLTLLAFALALMAKPMVVTLPFVLLLLDYWPLGRLQSGRALKNANGRGHESVTSRFHWPTFYRLLWEKVPFFILSAIISIVTFLVQRGVGALMGADMLPLWVRGANALISYVTYIGKMAWPSRLAVLYPYSFPASRLWLAAAAALVLLAISGSVFYYARNRGYLLTGWLWYLGTLLPVIGLVQAGQQALADRYTYMPLTGLFIIIAWGFPDALAGWRYKKPVLGVSAAVVLPVLMICSSLQVRHWRSSITLFEHTIGVAADSYVAHANLANAMFERGRLEEGITHSLRSIRINPDQAETHYDLGKAFSEQGKIDKAVAHYTEALRLQPDYTDAHYNLAIVFADHGRLGEAVSHYTEALRLDPNYFKAHNNLGVLFARQGRLDEAIVHYTKAAQLQPHSAEVHHNLASALLLQNKVDQAITHFTKALQLQPGSADIHHNLANTFVRQGSFDKAIAHFNEALRLRPNWPDVLNNLAWLLATHNQVEFRNPPEAIQLARRACELAARYRQPAVLDTLAAAYATADRFADAVATAQKAADLALSLGRKKLADDIRRRLELYRKEQPYRQSP